MTTLQTSTNRQLNNLIEFRQIAYEQILSGSRDSQFELVDALLSSGRKIGCFAELSLRPVFRRSWSSGYRALEKGKQAQKRLQVNLVKQVPRVGIQVYPLDTTMWAHPQARTLTGQVYGPSPTKALKKGSIVQGHQYSLLSWTPEARRSWSLTISNERLEPEQNAIEVGLKQVQALCQARPDPLNRVLDVIVGDGHYGNHHFFGGLQGLGCAGLARMRRDRVLYGPPPVYRGRGRPTVHGQRFAFKEPDSWPEPDETVDLVDPRWGQVRLRRWNSLHAKQEATVHFDVILAEVHLERDKLPAPLWLGYVPGHTDHRLQVVWSWFDYRWPIEPSIRFRKQQLHWTLPRFQASQACDRWTTLVDLAFWQLFLARDLVQDQPLPWQKAQSTLTPTRVLHSFASLFAQLGSPTRSPKARGKSPGWPPGRVRTRPQRHQPTKRSKKGVKSA
jgi:hypothetical protein